MTTAADTPNDLTELELLERQREIVAVISRLLAEELDLDETPVRGCFWKSLRQWQVSRGLETKAMRQMSREDRLESAEEIGGFLRELLARLLPPERHRDIGPAWAKAFVHYKATWND